MIDLFLRVFQGLISLVKSVKNIFRKLSAFLSFRKKVKFLHFSPTNPENSLGELLWFANFLNMELGLDGLPIEHLYFHGKLEHRKMDIRKSHIHDFVLRLSDGDVKAYAIYSYNSDMDNHYRNNMESLLSNF